MGVGVLNGFLGILLVGGALLRETPRFWTFEGGYPYALRRLVHLGVIPLWLVVTLLFLGVLGRALSGLRRRSPAAPLTLAVALAHGILLATATVIISWNNIQNFFTGLPLHHHP